VILGHQSVSSWLLRGSSLISVCLLVVGDCFALVSLGIEILSSMLNSVLILFGLWFCGFCLVNFGSGC
jgi:hypothetical protein